MSQSRLKSLDFYPQADYSAIFRWQENGRVNREIDLRNCISSLWGNPELIMANRNVAALGLRRMKELGTGYSKYLLWLKDQPDLLAEGVRFLKSEGVVPVEPHLNPELFQQKGKNYRAYIFCVAVGAIKNDGFLEKLFLLHEEPGRYYFDICLLITQFGLHPKELVK